MNFDEIYKNIINKNIILEENLLDSAIDWVSGKLKDTIKWTTEKLHKTIQLLFDKLSINNEQICKKIAQNIYQLLPKDQQKQIDTIKAQLNTKEFKQYFTNKIKENYSQDEIQNLSESQQKDLFIKYAEQYIKNNTITSEEIILEIAPAVSAALPYIGRLLYHAAIWIGIPWIATKVVTTGAQKVNNTFGLSAAGKAKNKAEAEKIKQQSAIEQAKQQLQLSNIQQEKLNIALAN